MRCRSRVGGYASSHDCRVNCGLRSADRRGRRLSRSRGVQRLGRATDMPAVARQKAAGRQCAVRADLPGLCHRHRAQSRAFPPAGLTGSRGLPHSPGPQVPADHLRDAHVLLGRADQQGTLEFRVQAPDVSRRRSVVLPYRRCMPARNRAPPPAGRACRYARHARTWPGTLATRRHNDHFGTQWKRSSDDGAADHNESSLRGRAKTQVALRDGLPVSLRPRLAEVPAAD